MAESTKNFMTWRIESRETSKEHTPVSKSRNSSVVPPIPGDLLSSGSKGSIEMNHLVKHALTNPFVPLGMLATVGCLVGMCKATLNRNMYRAQLYMRGRVAAQFFTVCVLTGGALYMGFRHPFGSSPGEIPVNPDLLTQKMLNRNSE